MRTLRLKLCGAALLAMTSVAQTPFDSTIVPSLVPLEIAANRGSAALWQSLKKLHTRASLMMITAHPDDEDGPMLTYESRGLGARVTLLTLNRGEGGANVMSSDFWDGLGLVRTQELLAAGQHYGVDQYWTRFCDYGFSKTLAESLSKWNHDSVLAEVVRVIRETRPLVVTSVFVGGPSDGHGNHQVAGLMAKEAFEAAGDPARFPEQLQAGLRPWKPLKYYTRGQGNLDIPTGRYDPLLGESYLQLARRGLGMQKSQNGGSWIPFGPAASPYRRNASRVAAPDKEQGFFDGIDISLPALAAEDSFAAGELRKINADIERAISRYKADSSELCAPPLAEGLKATLALLARTKDADLADELKVKAAQFNSALVEALGIGIRATVMPDHEVNPIMEQYLGDADTFQMAIPGQRFRVQVSVAGPVQGARIYLDSPYMNAWTISGRGENRFDVVAKDSLPYTRPFFSRDSIEETSYKILEPEFAGRPLAPYPLNAWAEFSYKGAPIKVGQVVQTTHRKTGLGVVYEPLTVGPAISIRSSPQAGIVPLSGSSFDLTVTLHSNVKGAAQGSVTLQLPTGWTSEPAAQAFATARDGEEMPLHFAVKPSSLSQQSYEIAAVAQFNGKEYREGYQAVGYPGLRPYFLYRPAITKMTGVTVTVAPGLKIGYVTGSGDEVPATLEELGVKVSYLSAGDLASAPLSQFDAILLGVRAYAVRPDLIQNNQRLLDYVKNGGVMIVQYNTPEFDHNYAPYPYKMGDDPEEVTDEESQMTFLNKDHPLFSWPNKISEHDFKGWIEERGSKFITTWDSRYEALLATNDAGQQPQKGGLLYARYGKGIYVYNAYALYRELPEGVPGAFRLMANLLSLAKNPSR